MNYWKIILSAVVALTTLGALAAPVDQYNVVWDTPSENHHGSMPLGNGDIAFSPDGRQFAT